MNDHNYDLLGIGIGPFNLSLAALLDGVRTSSTSFKNIFLECKEEFNWHQELMFTDSLMQTGFLKDLVTPVDPTNPYSFLNYLVENNQFYQFLITERSAIHRFEFESYCKWVSKKLDHSLKYKECVRDITFKDEKFIIKTDQNQFSAKNLCLGSGPVKNIPSPARPFLGDNVFHAKSKHMMDLSLKGKRVIVIGGGQTGLEIFRNGLNEKWGRPSSMTLISGRDSLQPLDEVAFTNEFFTPEFVQTFLTIDTQKKKAIVQKQLLTSDGNTPSYLKDFYNELYLDKFYHQRFPKYQICPMRWVENISKMDHGYLVEADNGLYEQKESFKADIIILATGFKTQIPEYLSGLFEFINFDHESRPLINDNYTVNTTIDSDNKIYAVNFSRHIHGIADPQTSLMAWRSAVIINDLLNEKIYQTDNSNSNFISYNYNKNQGDKL